MLLLVFFKIFFTDHLLHHSLHLDRTCQLACQILGPKHPNSRNLVAHRPYLWKKKKKYIVHHENKSVCYVLGKNCYPEKRNKKLENRFSTIGRFYYREREWRLWKGFGGEMECNQTCIAEICGKRHRRKEGTE